MNLEFLIERSKNKLFLLLILSIIIFSITYLSLLFPIKAIASSESQGEHLFIKNCAGCHVNGGNIIRRNKTLKLKDLKRNGINNPEAIAKIALNGIGLMSGYKDILEKDEEVILANWIWEKSQNAWIQG